MPTIAEIGTILAALLSIFFTEFFGWRKVKAKIEEAAAKNEKFIGVTEGKPSLSLQHEDMQREISRQIGNVNDNGSLTAQNQNLLKTINSYKEEKEKRIKKFSKKQKDIEKGIENIRDFFDDWERSNDELNNMKEKLELLTQECESLKQENQTLKQKLSRLQPPDRRNEEYVNSNNPGAKDNGYELEM